VFLIFELVAAYQKNFDDNAPHFTSIQGHANLTYITFATPTEQGLGFLQPDNYAAAVKEAREQGILTLVSVGGWSYRNMFKFFTTVNLQVSAKSQILHIFLRPGDQFVEC
jgi:hypothetical protein